MNINNCQVGDKEGGNHGGQDGVAYTDKREGLSNASEDKETHVNLQIDADGKVLDVYKNAKVPSTKVPSRLTQAEDGHQPIVLLAGSWDSGKDSLGCRLPGVISGNKIKYVDANPLGSPRSSGFSDKTLPGVIALVLVYNGSSRITKVRLPCTTRDILRIYGESLPTVTVMDTSLNASDPINKNEIPISLRYGNIGPITRWLEDQIR